MKIKVTEKRLAEILEQRVCDGTLGFVHSVFYKIMRLWIKDAKVLITAEDDKIYVHSKPFGKFKKVEKQFGVRISAVTIASIS